MRLSEAPDFWRPTWKDEHGEIQPWDVKAYRDLRIRTEALPPGFLRDQALYRIRSLDCANKTLASCDPSLPPANAAWRSALAVARVDALTYGTALAAALKPLVCSGFRDADSVLRLVSTWARLQVAGPEAPMLADVIGRCSADADRAKLPSIKQDATKKARG